MPGVIAYSDTLQSVSIALYVQTALGQAHTSAKVDPTDPHNRIFSKSQELFPTVLYCQYYT